MGEHLIVLKPIGVVKNRATKEEIRSNRRNLVSEIVLDKDLVGGLRGIEDFSHIYVIFLAHKARQRRSGDLTLHPGGNQEMPAVGVFASRSPSRPNRIALSLVEFLGRRNETVKVRGLDAIDGSPVLDIKPYDYFDVVEKIRVPSWWMKLHGRRRSGP